jgi:hypothetical protein
MYANAPKQLQITRESAIKRQIFKDNYVSPSEYCAKWVTKISGLQPDARGYKSACVRELMRVTGLAKSTIGEWGIDYTKFDENPSKAVLAALKWADQINSVKEGLGIRPDLS